MHWLLSITRLLRSLTSPKHTVETQREAAAVTRVFIHELAVQSKCIRTKVHANKKSVFFSEATHYSWGWGNHTIHNIYILAHKQVISEPIA